jgi:hypothetical protein
VFRFPATFAPVRFGNLLGTGQFSRCDAQCFCQRPHSPGRWRCATALQACNGQGVEPRPAGELGLREKTFQSDASQCVAECHLLSKPIKPEDVIAYYDNAASLLRVC